MLPQNAPLPHNAATFTPDQIASEQAAFMRKVYAIMAFGLGATALTSLVVVHSPAVMQFIFGGGAGVFYGLLLAELVMVWTFAALARRLSAVGAAALFYVYAIMNGLTLSVIFLRYTQGSIASTFFVTAGTFGVMSIWGYTTKRDLTGFGNFLFMGLIGILLASLANFFFKSAALSFVISVLGVLIFTGLTAWDTQKIKNTYYAVGGDTAVAGKAAIMGALALYLDFLNIFLFLLRFMGNRR